MDIREKDNRRESLADKKKTQEKAENHKHKKGARDMRAGEGPRCGDTQDTFNLPSVLCNSPESQNLASPGCPLRNNERADCRSELSNCSFLRNWLVSEWEGLV